MPGMRIPEVAPPPLPAALAGHNVRFPRVEDVEAIFELGSAADRAVIGTTLITRAEVEQSIVAPSAQQDSRQVLVERDGVAVAWPWIQQATPAHLAGDIQVHPDVAPHASDLLVAWALDWFDQIARANFDNGRLDGGASDRIQLGNWCYEQDSSRPDQLRAAGYDQSRSFIRMTRTVEATDSYPRPSDGVVVRGADIDPGDPAHGDAKLVHSIVSTSFADHYNYAPTPFELWFARRTDDPGFDPSLWFVAEHAGTPLGAMIMNRELQEDQNAGYVHYLGVLREGRGRGLAKALLSRGFATSRDEGRTSVKLFVDAESPTGATRLYESVGMTREQVILEWQKWLLP
jgi:mycothiol synthase